MLYRLIKIVHTSNAIKYGKVIQYNNQLRVCASKSNFYASEIIRLYSNKNPCGDGMEPKEPKVDTNICKDLRTPHPLSSPCKPHPPKICAVPVQSAKPAPDPCDPEFKRRDPGALYEECKWEDVSKRSLEGINWKRIVLLGLLLVPIAFGVYVYDQQETKKIQKAAEKKKRVFLRGAKPVCRIPERPRDFPSHVPYLLIGGGTASFAAFRAIKSTDPNAKVLVISNECNYPYMRPPLSKEIWFTDTKTAAKKLMFKQWNGSERSLFYEPQDFYTPVGELSAAQHGGVSVALGYNVKSIDVVNRKALFIDEGQNETEITYDKCLVATGARPKNLAIFEQAHPAIKNKVTLFREVFDFQELSEVCQESEAIAVVGGGFLGSELACALGKVSRNSTKKFKVYQIFRENGNMAHVLPEYLSHWTTKKVKKEGVTVLSETEVEDVSMNEQKRLVLHLNSGRTVLADHVIVSVGVQPNTELAKTSDLEVDPDLGGFLCNTEMEARSHLYIAGDCSCFYDTKLGRRRVEHHDHAVVSGRLAGENMAGGTKPYLHQSMFWSDLGPDVGYEAIGIVDSSLPTVGVFAKENDSADDEVKPQVPSNEKHQYDANNNEFNRGVVFYLKDDTVVGIVLWNIFNRMSVARQVLKDQRKYDDLNEVAKLFNIHDAEGNPEDAEEEEAVHGDTKQSGAN